MVRRPHELTAVEAARALRSGELSATALMEACIERIREREPKIHAWAHLDIESALVAARNADRESPSRLLHGIPVGVKDIIDTSDFLTEMGSPIFSGSRPRADASCVALIRMAGGIIIGKTVTTELAFVKSNGTANPWDTARSCGASSTGSAAGVADRMIPFALGTQTASSITRPAAYCGVVGYKSSLGAFSLAGIKMFAHSLDSLGGFGRSVEDMMLLHAVLLSANFDLQKPIAAKCPTKAAFYRTPFWARADADTRSVIHDVLCEIQHAGIEVTDLDLPPVFGELEEAHKTVMSYESARCYAFEWTCARSSLSDPLQALLEQGWACGRSEYDAARRLAASCRNQFAAALEGIDLVITPSAPGEAPLGLSSIVDPIFSRLWSLMGTPTVTLPLGRSSNNMPIGVQFVAPQGYDDRLLSHCLSLERLLSVDMHQATQLKSGQPH